MTKEPEGRKVATNEFHVGMKLVIDQDPYVITSNNFVKPGKGQSFYKVKLKNLKNGKVVEKTFKSGEKAILADVEEITMRMLYSDGENIVFMDESSFEQHEISLNMIGEKSKWMKEEVDYQVTFYEGNVIDVTPPNFLEVLITETSPGLRGDTTGRVLKPATIETGATIQVPIFLEQNEKIKVDTRDGSYVSRV